MIAYPVRVPFGKAQLGTAQREIEGQAQGSLAWAQGLRSWSAGIRLTAKLLTATIAGRRSDSVQRSIAPTPE